MINLDFLIPYTQEAGAGVLAWAVMSLIRHLFPLPDEGYPTEDRLMLIWYQILYVDDFAYIFVGILTATIVALLQWILTSQGILVEVNPPMAIFFATLTHHISKRWKGGSDGRSASSL